LIIKTATYNLDDIIKILAIRATTENIRISKDALAFLGKIGNETSLRYFYNKNLFINNFNLLSM
jgi:RuvB-like protein 1 (pontin 52)